MFIIEEELKKLPDKPGVYIMHDSRDSIIYVGKAVSLKNRVRQYFQNSRNKTAKIEQMVSQIHHFEYIITDSELEALVLECNLIKEHSPKYNTMLKDDKSYPYIKVTIQEDFPRILFSRKIKKDKSKYFGPYTSAGAVKSSLDLLHKLYKIRVCSRNLPKDIGKDRPCLYYHINQCDAPCQGRISREEYGKSIQKAMAFLNGNYSDVIKELQKKMEDASERMEFEEAIEYRELIASVKQIAEKQKITDNHGEDKDIIALAKDEKDGIVQVFFIRDGRLLGREHFYMRISSEDSRKAIITSFIKQFYSGTPFIPKELMIQEEIEEREILEHWLSDKRGQKVRIRIPVKGSKEKLVELAAKNAQLILNQDREKLKREESRTIGAMEEIAEWLELKNVKRIEAFDISNINGFQSVGSMIVFERGKPKRSDYRKFKIKWIKGADDYASLAEVLERRFSHGLKERRELEEKSESKEYGSFTKFPDLIMMDGGKGQVNAAKGVLNHLQLSIPVCGMVKDDNHRTRGLYFENREIEIDTRSQGFHLLTRIQDEAHRFAITYHRSLRTKGQIHSVLDEIEGIGPARRKALMKYYQDLEEIKKASVEDLAKIPSMNRKSAEALSAHFLRGVTDDYN